jgi:hypothetical protein
MNHNCVCGHPPAEHDDEKRDCSAELDDINPCTCSYYEKDTDD